MPIPGSLEQCKRCGRLVTIGRDAVPRSKITGLPRSRGHYCAACATLLGLRASKMKKAKNLIADNRRYREALERIAIPYVLDAEAQTWIARAALGLDGEG